MSARWKYSWLSVAGLGAALALWFTATTPAETTFYRAFLQGRRAADGRGVPYIVLTYLMIVGMSNAVNLTDGLDGLAIMPGVMVAGALGVFAWASDNVICRRITWRFRRCPARAKC